MNRATGSRVAFLALLVGLVAWAGLLAEDKPQPANQGLVPGAVKPKPISVFVKKGLAYLAGRQCANGGWGQGGGWRMGQNGGRIEGVDVEDPADVASTCIAALALLRAGNTPKEGPYAPNVARAMEFICGHIEKADTDSLYVTDVRGTQAQTKIGPFVDTFLASLVLAEMKNKMPSDREEKRLAAALTKTIAKIEKNQKEDGTFAGNNGWASIFSQALCSKGLNRAAQMGVAVKGEALARADKIALASVDVGARSFKGPAAALPSDGRSLASAGRIGFSARSAGPLARSAAEAPSDAGVAIYNISNNYAALQEASNTNKIVGQKAKKILADKNASKEDRDQARTDLDRIAKVEEAQKVAVSATVRQLENKQFLQGFGSNGGEEFLSYLNISEALVVKGGDEWAKWDKSVTDNLTRIQNQDGSWSGNHCITGKTFCTAASLLVLLADRTPIPAEAKVQEKK